MENFITCLNAIAPIFILVILGAFLKKLNVVSDEFSSKANNLVFKAALPCSLFLDIAGIDIANQFDARLIGYSAGVTLVLFVLATVFSGVIKDSSKRAAFAQGVFRSNYAILGVPLTKAIFPPEISVNASVLMAFAVPLYNVLAVILLTSLLDSKKGIRGIFTGILKNPLIIGAVLGVIVSLLKLQLPALILKPVGYLSQMCVPLSLIVIGASFKFEKARETLSLALTASIIKTLVVPLLFITPAFFLGITGGKLGVLYLFFAAPAAVSSYTMIRNMGGDYHLAGNIILISTAMSFFTILFGITAMKSIGLF